MIGLLIASYFVKKNSFRVCGLDASVSVMFPWELTSVLRWFDI